MPNEIKIFHMDLNQLQNKQAYVPNTEIADPLT